MYSRVFLPRSLARCFLGARMFIFVSYSHRSGQSRRCLFNTSGVVLMAAETVPASMASFMACASRMAVLLAAASVSLWWRPGIARHPLAAQRPAASGFCTSNVTASCTAGSTATARHTYRAHFSPILYSSSLAAVRRSPAGARRFIPFRSESQKGEKGALCAVNDHTHSKI